MRFKQYLLVTTSFFKSLIDVAPLTLELPLLNRTLCTNCAIGAGSDIK